SLWRFLMSIVVRIRPRNMTRQQYDTVRNARTEAGDWPADGCQLHVLFGDENDLRVSEVWESQAKLVPSATSYGHGRVADSIAAGFAPGRELRAVVAVFDRRPQRPSHRGEPARLDHDLVIRTAEENEERHPRPRRAPGRTRSLPDLAFDLPTGRTLGSCLPT
ncbi:MAG: hypothetical protein ACAH79_07380, partial [Thermoleophilia bacterium]